MDQTQRLDSVAAFVAGQVPVLVSTPLLGRGMDMPNVKQVWNKFENEKLAWGRVTLKEVYSRVGFRRTQGLEPQPAGVLIFQNLAILFLFRTPNERDVRSEDKEIRPQGIQDYSFSDADVGEDFLDRSDDEEADKEDDDDSDDDVATDAEDSGDEHGLWTSHCTSVHVFKKKYCF